MAWGAELVTPNLLLLSVNRCQSLSIAVTYANTAPVALCLNVSMELHTQGHVIIA